MSNLLENLTEEECYLLAILTDRSGIDQAEFLWKEPSNPDNCFRARPYQWPWWRSTDTRQVELSARTVGKTLGISLRGFAHLFVNPGQEMLVTAPELIFLEPIIDLIEFRILSTRLSRELLPHKGGRGDITHRPFMLNAVNGARLMGRIPQRDGRGVKGQHPVWLEMDESQDYPEKGYKELIETLKRGMPGAQWRMHGVTNGVGGFFYDLTKGASDTSPLRTTVKREETEWTIHRLVAMLREDWTDKERQDKISDYGSKEAPDYLRNVLGQHGPSSNVIFILHRLMKCADDDLSSAYNQDEYFHATVRDTDLQRAGSDILDYLDFPVSLKKYKTVWVGMDIGLIGDPTEILIFAEDHLTPVEVRARTGIGRDDQNPAKAVPKDGSSCLKLIGRISLYRVSEPRQVDVMMEILDFFRPKAFALDSTGVGLPFYQEIQERLQKINTPRSREALESIKGYNFGQKVLVDFDPNVDLAEEATLDEQAKEAGIKRYVLEVSTDHLRSLVDNERLWLPFDRDLISQFSGQTYSYSRNTMDAYGRRKIFSKGVFHALDAARMAAIAHKQHAIEALMATKEPEVEPVIDIFMQF